jgi:iron complex transport system permease protein
MSAVLLAGIALSFFFSALTSLILYINETQAYNIMTYLMGSFWSVSWMQAYIMACVMVPGMIALLYYARDLNLMVLGDDTAQTMGVDVEHSKIAILFIMTALASTTVAFCGSIGFVGLLMPHIMRYFVGSNHRRLIPASGLAGAILLIWADILARTLIPPLEIPVGIFTAILGGPFFIYLVIKRKKTGEIT